MSSGRSDPSRAQLARRGLQLVVALAVLVVGLRAWSGGFFGGPSLASAQVRNAGGSLLPGADVKLRGVLVGKVTGVSALPDDTVKVGLAFRDGRLEEVPANVRARILPATVFGTSYVDLVVPGPRAGHALRAGATIPEDRSAGTVELQQALDDIDGLTRALGPAQLANALSATAMALDGKGRQLGDMLDGLNAYLRQVQPAVPLIRSDLHKLADNLELIRRTAPDLLTAAQDSLSTIRMFTAEQKTIAAALAGATSLAHSGNALLDRNRAALVRFLDDTAVVLDAVYDHRDQAFGQAMATNRTLAGKIFGTLHHGWVDTTGVIQPAAPGYYTAADCPRYGSAHGDNCPGGGR